LNFFKNYFLTGDYSVAGVGLQGTGVGGTATGFIAIADVPANATILAAWLYWQTMGNGLAVPPMFNGSAIDAALITNLGTAVSPCQVLPKVTSYRADVLRYLAVGPVDPLYFANYLPANAISGAYRVSLADSGNPNVAPSTLGASLVLIWSKAGVAQPYKGIVMFDGVYTLAPPNLKMNVDLKGFYEASKAGPTARVTHIAGNGGAGMNAPSDALFNGQRLGANPNMVFTGAQGKAWDNPTFDVSAMLPGDAATATTGSDSTLLPKGGIRKCITWSAVIMSTTVQDTDGDGLLDTWETNGFTDMDGSFVDLKGMGADPNKKDIFIEIDWMNAGAGEPAAGHKPKQAALDMICATFSGRGIAVHFDIGQDAGGIAGNACTAPNVAFSGGNAIGHSNVINWKAADAPLLGRPDFNLLKKNNFANNRRFLFHYCLWGHQFGIGGAAAKTSSGIADLPGGDYAITLGPFTHPTLPADNMVGTLQEQAGTMMHEFGHNLFLHHAGAANTPNRIPQYQSVMNYRYQMLLLQNAGNTSVVDYSGQNLGALDETMLNEGAGVGAATYRTRYWSTPNAVDNFLANTIGFRNIVIPDPRGCMVNVVDRQTLRVNGAIDWNNNGKIDPANVMQDIGGVCGLDNYNGSNDWTAIDLRQLGSRPNYSDAGTGPTNPASLDITYEEYTQLAPPTVPDLTVSLSGTTPQLSWSPSDLAIVTGYDVYRFVGTDPFAAAAITNGIVYLGTVPQPLGRFIDMTASSGTQYTYFVSSVNEFNYSSGPSNFATLTTP
jgi:hypothetical protein